MYIFGLLLILFINISYTHSTPYTSDCNEKLLENREFVPDSAFSQSSYEDNFKGKYARDSSNEDQAWCPLKKTGTFLREFVSIDLGQLCVIKMVMTRGRNAVGYVSAQSYVIKHKQENESEWKFYRNYSGSKELIARKDPLNENFISLEPPLIARWIRVFPFQPSNEKICLKLQLYGCINTNHVVEYQMLDGSKYLTGLGSNKFKDITYDGKLIENGTLIGGIGKLADRDTESNSELTPIVDGAKKFVGWDHGQIRKAFVTIVFRFDSGRNFTTIALRVANHFDHDIRVFKSVMLTFGWGYNGVDIARQSGKQTDNVQSDDRMMTTRWIEIDIKGQVGNFVKVDLYFGSQWLILSEINFKSEFLPESEGHILSNIATDKSSTFKTRNHIRPELETNMQPLTRTLGLICGILGLIILMGSLVLIYLHRKRKLNSPSKGRVVQLKFPGDENRFLRNDSQFYSTKLTKGTIIPFNISPYKNYTTQRNPNDLSSYHQTLLTPRHNLLNFPSPNVVIKSVPNHNCRGIDSCIYTSLPASDTDSLDTPDHKLPNSHQLIPHNTPITPYWSNQSIRRSDPLDKVYFNPNVADDINSNNFQCYQDNGARLDLNAMGLIYSNRDHSQDYDSFMSQTINDTDDDTGSLACHESLDFNLPYQETIMGCCGNSTMMSQSVNVIPNTDRLVPSLKLTNFDDLVPLGAGRWGDLFIDISCASNAAIHLEGNVGTINQNYGSGVSEKVAVLVKILDDNAPFEIRDRFQHEYTVLSNLNHHGISRIISANFDLNSNRHIVISEYSLHGNLHSYFQNMSCESKFRFLDSTLNMEVQNIFKNHQNTMAIILQLAEALCYLESNQIVHRDVSCRNCLIVRMSDKELIIKLVDSAMGQVQFRSYYVRPMTILQGSSVPMLQSVTVSTALLPLRWSANETIVHTLFSTKSDVFAFGITVWEIYNRCRGYPMPELSEEQIVLSALDLNYNHINVLPSLQMAPTCAKEVSDLIRQCINPDPRYRPNFCDIRTFVHNKASSKF